MLQILETHQNLKLLVGKFCNSNLINREYQNATIVCGCWSFIDVFRNISLGIILFWGGGGILVWEERKVILVEEFWSGKSESYTFIVIAVDSLLFITVNIVSSRRHWCFVTHHLWDLPDFGVTLCQAIINHGALPCLLSLLTHNHKKSIKKEACWTISNITAGNKEQIQVN